MEILNSILHLYSVSKHHFVNKCLNRDLNEFHGFSNLRIYTFEFLMLLEIYLHKFLVVYFSLQGHSIKSNSYAFHDEVFMVESSILSLNLMFELYIENDELYSNLDQN